MSVAAPEEVATLLTEPHHDGSEAYVLEQPEAPGDVAVVRLRVPQRGDADAVVLRYIEDGEPRTVSAERDEETPTETWWRASVPVTGRSVRYRWLVSRDGTYAWVNGAGTVRHDVPDADDFVLALDPGGPAWHVDGVVYEIFPDRFARGGVAETTRPPGWAILREWDDLPIGRGRDTPFEWFGGDLPGVEQRLGYLEALGVSTLYLTPIFPAMSTHRYDAISFDEVDPLLGGDAAFASLLAAARGRGIRVLCDLTPNHCGSEHPWFRTARADANAPERELFWFEDSLPNGYESWLGVPTLPKLDWRSEELRRRMTGVVRRWLDEGLDGWRIDVANMVGRRGEIDVNADVARAIRGAVDETGSDRLLVAEHNHDFRSDLQGDGWHGVMNYPGTLRPIWSWLRGEEYTGEFLGLQVPVPRVDGLQATNTMRAFRAGIPWRAALHSWTLLDSHDTARFRTVSGSRQRHEVGVGMQMTTPGVPMVFAGDEIGLEGEWGEDARRTMPWDRRERWDTSLFDTYRRLIALRRSSPALARGGIRYAHVGEDAIAYLREAPGERLLCLAARADHAAITLPLDLLGCEALEPLEGANARHAGANAVLPSEGPAFHVWRLT